MLCKTRLLATYLFRNSVFGVVALIIATLHVIRPSIVLLTGGLIAAGFGIVLYNIGLSGLAIGLLFLGFARPRPSTSLRPPVNQPLRPPPYPIFPACLSQPTNTLP